MALDSQGNPVPGSAPFDPLRVDSYGVNSLPAMYPSPPSAQVDPRNFYTVAPGYTNLGVPTNNSTFSDRIQNVVVSALGIAGNLYASRIATKNAVSLRPSKAELEAQQTGVVAAQAIDTNRNQKIIIGIVVVGIVLVAYLLFRRGRR